MQDPAAYYQTMMAKQQQQQPQFAEQEQLKCPRCDSPNTKFCYYNLSQPRHFCKSCRRYWTKGGALRNVPVGGGSRKNAKRSTSSSSSSSPCNNTHKKTKTPDPDHDQRNSQKPDLDPARMLYGFPIGDQDVKGMEMGGSFSSLLSSNMQLGLGGIMLDGSGWDSGMVLGLSRPEPSNPWTDLALNRAEKN